MEGKVDVEEIMKKEENREKKKKVLQEIKQREH